MILIFSLNLSSLNPLTSLTQNFKLSNSKPFPITRQNWLQRLWKLKPIDGFRFLRKNTFLNYLMKHGGGLRGVY
jgi:hypothetical protein